MNGEKVLPQVKTEEIAKRGEEIYERKFKKEYEPSHNGKFLAIETESEDAFLGENSVVAVEKARERYPEKIFYIKKIGFPAAEIISSYFPPKYPYDRLF